MVATLTDATVVAPIFTNLTPSRDILQVFNTYFLNITGVLNIKWQLDNNVYMTGEVSKIKKIIINI